MSKSADELRCINWLGRNRLIIDICNDAADKIEQLEWEAEIMRKALYHIKADADIAIAKAGDTHE